MKRLFVLVVLALLLVVLYLVFNGKHNKLPFNTETNIPFQTKDTSINTNIKVDKNTGTIIGTQNNFDKESTKK